MFEEFRFHMALTGRLDDERRGPVVEMLHLRFGKTGMNEFVIDRLVLFRQNDAGARFQIIGQ